MTIPPMVLSIRRSKVNTNNVSNLAGFYCFIVTVKITVLLGFYAYCKNCCPREICGELGVGFLSLSFVLILNCSFAQNIQNP